MKLMFDFQVLAFQSDMTRVLLVQDGSRRVEPRVSRRAARTRASTRRRTTAAASRRSSIST